MQQVQVNLRLYASQLEGIEEARGQMSRNAWLRQAIVDRIEEEKLPEPTPLAVVEEPKPKTTGVFKNKLAERQLRAAGMPL